MLLLDSNAFIEPSNRYYPLDGVPGYWDLLSDAHQTSLVCSIRPVLTELQRQEDELKVWAVGLPGSFFLDIDSDDILDAYSQVIEWVHNHSVFYQAAKDDFAAGADGWLVATARVHGMVLVTQEILKPANCKVHVSIRNACQQFGVQCMNVYEMVRQLGGHFRHVPRAS